MLVGALLLIVMTVELTSIKACFEDDNCRKNWKTYRRMKKAVSVFSITIVLMAILLYLVAGRYDVLLVFMALPSIMLVFMAVSFSHTVHELRNEDSDRRRKIFAALMSLIILFSFVFTINMGWRYATIPDIEEEYLIQIENPNGTPYHVLLPNLINPQDPESHPDASDYSVEDGECRILPYENGEYLNISSSSPELTIRYHVKGDFIHEAKGWEFPEEFIFYDGTEYYMNVSFHSPHSSIVTLHLSWTDSKSWNIIGGEYTEISCDAILRNGNQSVKVDFSRTEAP